MIHNAGTKSFDGSRCAESIIPIITVGQNMIDPVIHTCMASNSACGEDYQWLNSWTWAQIRIFSREIYHNPNMITSSKGNIFRVTGHLCGEFTGQRWISRTKASDAELWCFLSICVRINGWANNGKAGDLRRYRAHYDVLFCIFYSGKMISKFSIIFFE